jgi:hypothetical protein
MMVKDFYLVLKIAVRNYSWSRLAVVVVAVLRGPSEQSR